MTKEEMLLKVKSNLKLEDDTQDLAISDVIQDACNYCNLQYCLPEEMEPVIRRKVKAIMSYEAANGTGFVREIQSIKEGDGSITYAQTEGNTRATVYGLGNDDKAQLRRFRRLKGYDKPVCSDV